MIRRDVLDKVRVGLHPHEIFNVFEHDLDDGIIIGDIGKLRVVELGHERTGGARIVALCQDEDKTTNERQCVAGSRQIRWGEITIVHLRRPYRAIRSRTKGACTLVIYSRYASSLRPRFR